MAERSKRTERTSSLVKRDGALAMTFVNTASERRRPLADYADLVDWARQHGALSPAAADGLGRLAAERPEDAEDAFAAAEELREVLARTFNAAADGEEPLREAADSLSAFLTRTLPARRLVVSEGRYDLDWDADREEDLERPLWRVVLSAAEVLTSDDYRRIVRCFGEDCDVLFVARNQGSPRKWCDVSCSHRARSLRRYHDKVKPYKAQVRRKAREHLRKRRSGSRSV